MDKGFEIINDNKADLREGGAGTQADFGNDLAGDDGVDLNAVNDFYSSNMMRNRVGAAVAAGIITATSPFIPIDAQMGNNNEFNAANEGIGRHAVLDSPRFTPDLVAEEWAEQHGARIVAGPEEKGESGPTPLEVAGGLADTIDNEVKGAYVSCGREQEEAVQMESGTLSDDDPDASG
jgi:hypothetical protein